MAVKKKTFLISLYLNGERYKIFTSEPLQLVDLLEFFSYQKELVIIEHNGKITSLLKSTKLIKQDDDIEVITIVGGG